MIIEKKMAEFSNKRAEMYNNAMKLFPNARSMDINVMNTYLNPQKGDKILGIGEGNGFFVPAILTEIGTKGIFTVTDPSNDQLDLLLDVRKKQLAGNDLTSLEDMSDPVPIDQENTNQIVEEVEPEEIKIETKDFPEIIKTSFEDVTNKTLNLPIQKEFEEIPDPEPTINKDDKYKLYKIYREKNKGEYLKEYKCVKSISLKNCLKYCNNNNECDGVEWNPKFYNYENVCCPYKNVGELVPRPDKYKYGRFYLKDYKRNTDRSKTYMFHN
jgi:hypothetical protein